MSEAPGGGGYLPSRCSTSGRFTPAASTSIKTSPAAGTGSGRSASFRTSGGPDWRSQQRACLSSLKTQDPKSHVHFSPDGNRGDDKQRHEFTPAALWRAIAAHLALDVGAHQVLAEVVVDHVTAILVDEAHALFGARLACTSRTSPARPPRFRD